jgi:hypothetical protein
LYVVPLWRAFLDAVVAMTPKDEASYGVFQAFPFFEFAGVWLLTPDGPVRQPPARTVGIDLSSLSNSSQIVADSIFEALEMLANDATPIALATAAVLRQYVASASATEPTEVKISTGDTATLKFGDSDLQWKAMRTSYALCYDPTELCMVQSELFPTSTPHAAAADAAPVAETPVAASAPAVLVAPPVAAAPAVHPLDKVEPRDTSPVAPALVQPRGSPPHSECPTKTVYVKDAEPADRQQRDPTSDEEIDGFIVPDKLRHDAATEKSNAAATGQAASCSMM